MGVSKMHTTSEVEACEDVRHTLFRNYIFVE